MIQAKSGDTVRVHYTGILSDGSVFDTSENGTPLQFTLGEGQVIPGFENAVTGMSPGDSKTTNISVNDAYGERRDEMIIEVERSRLPQDLNLEVGEQLQLKAQNGQFLNVVISDISEESVTLDANHPLAGQDLTFKIELIEIVH